MNRFARWFFGKPTDIRFDPPVTDRLAPVVPIGVAGAAVPLVPVSSDPPVGSPLIGSEDDGWRLPPDPPVGP